MKTLTQKLNESFIIESLDKEVKAILMNKYKSFKVVKDEVDNDYESVLNTIMKDVEDGTSKDEVIKSLKNILNKN